MQKTSQPGTTPRPSLITNPYGHVSNPNAKILLPTSGSQVEVLASKDHYVPEGLKRRALNDVEMVPDRGFVKQLKKLDPEFEVLWDWWTSKWEIWRFPKNGNAPQHQITVQTKNKTYRELGADILLQLQKADPWRFNTKNELYAYFDEMDNQIRRRQEKAFKEKISAIARETFLYAQGVPHIQVPQKFKLMNSIGVS